MQVSLQAAYMRSEAATGARYRSRRRRAACVRAALGGRAVVGELLVRRPARGKATLVLKPPGREQQDEQAAQASNSSTSSFVPASEFAAGDDLGGVRETAAASSGERAPPNPDTLVVIFPGYGLAPEQYSPLAEAIQRRSETEIWVVVPKFIRNIMLGEKAAETVRNAMQSTHVNAVSYAAVPTSDTPTSAHSNCMTITMKHHDGKGAQ